MEKIKLGRYRHFKGGEYEILGLAKNSESLEEFVIYQALYGEKELWIRPKSMFFERITRGGKEISRFEYIGAIR